MRISKLFNQNDQIPLVIKTLANDVGSVSALGKDAAPHLEAAKEWFSNPKAPPPDPDNKAFRAFALPIMDAFLRKTDPSFTPSPKGVNPSSQHVDWITRVYAQRAVDGTPIKSEDLQKIYNEIEDFYRIQNVLKEKEIPTSLTDYKTYDDFTKIIHPFMSRKDKFRTIENAPDHVLDNASVLYNGKEGAIVVPHTYEASVYFGSTHWCISYDNTREHFDDVFTNSPMLMYLPNTYTIRNKRAKDIVSGKVAVVGNKIYKENDDEQDILPQHITVLRDAALNHADTGVKEYLNLFGDRQIPPDWTRQPRQVDRYSQVEQFRRAQQSRHAEQLTQENEYLDPELAQAIKDLRLNEDSEETAYYRKEDIWSADIRFTNFLNKHPELKKNKVFILAAIKVNGNMLQHADDALKKDKSFVLAAVKQNGWALQFADDRLKKDKDVVLTTVKQNGWALQFADNRLKKDKQVVMAAIAQLGAALQHADKSLKKNKPFILAIVNKSGRALQFADDALKKDKDVALAAIRQNTTIILKIDKDLFEDVEFARGLLDIAADADAQNRRAILNHIHKIPALFGHMTADIEVLRARLDTYSAKNPTSEQEFEPQEDLALA